MTNFVLEQFKLLYNSKISQDEYVSRTKKYSDFLKQPLKLEMFLPCDEEGNALEHLDVNCLKNESCTCGEEDYNDCKDLKRELRKAEQKVLFKGILKAESDEKEIRVTFESIAKNDISYICSVFDYKEGFTVEHLEDFNLKLTNAALKQLGFCS